MLSVQLPFKLAVLDEINAQPFGHLFGKGMQLYGGILFGSQFQYMRKQRQLSGSSLLIVKLKHLDKQFY
jgi:hypothetical protein